MWGVGREGRSPDRMSERSKKAERSAPVPNIPRLFSPEAYHKSNKLRKEKVGHAERSALSPTSARLERENAEVFANLRWFCFARGWLLNQFTKIRVNRARGNRAGGSNSLSPEKIGHQKCPGGWNIFVPTENRQVWQVGHTCLCAKAYHAFGCLWA